MARLNRCRIITFHEFSPSLSLPYPPFHRSRLLFLRQSIFRGGKRGAFARNDRDEEGDEGGARPKNGGRLVNGRKREHRLRVLEPAAAGIIVCKLSCGGHGWESSSSDAAAARRVAPQATRESSARAFSPEWIQKLGRNIALCLGLSRHFPPLPLLSPAPRCFLFDSVSLSPHGCLPSTVFDSFRGCCCSGKIEISCVATRRSLCDVCSHSPIVEHYVLMFNK